MTWSAEDGHLGEVRNFQELSRRGGFRGGSRGGRKCTITAVPDSKGAAMRSAVHFLLHHPVYSTRQATAERDRP